MPQQIVPSMHLSMSVYYPGLEDLQKTGRAPIMSGNTSLYLNEQGLMSIGVKKQDVKVTIETLVKQYDFGWKMYYSPKIADYKVD